MEANPEADTRAAVAAARALLARTACCREGLAAARRTLDEDAMAAAIAEV